MVVLFRPYLSEQTSPNVEEKCEEFDDENKGDYQKSQIQCKWEDCGKRFENLDSLSNHVSKDHSLAGEAGLFYCKWNNCSRGSRGFNARYKMLVHVRTHTNEKPHQCCQCNKSFSRAENLKIHCRSHTGERPYVCTVPGCGKAYSNSSDRFKHSRTHTVEKPYICKIAGCSKRYTDPSSLRKHVKTYKHYESNAAKIAETTSEVSVEDNSDRSINDNVPQKNLNEQSSCFTLAEDQTHTKNEKLLLTSFPPSRPIYYSVLSPHFTSRRFARNDADKYADNSLTRHSILYSYSAPRNWVQLETDPFPCIDDNVEPLDLSMNNNCIAY